MGERLFGDVHQSLFGRGAKEGGVRRSFGSEGAGGGLPRPLQPPASSDSALDYRTPAEFAMAVSLDRKVEDSGKPEELESVLTLS